MKFAIKDHVRVIATCNCFDKVGPIAKIDPEADHPYAVSGLAPWHLWFGPDELTLAEPPQVAS